MKRAVGNLIKFLKFHEEDQSAYFVIATDNDRLRDFPDEHLPPAKKHSQNRYHLILTRLQEGLGDNPKKWPFQGALAVPVESIESWLLLSATDKTEIDLPTHARSNPSRPEAGLKDLRDEAVKDSGMPYDEFLFDLGSSLDTEKLALKSVSFRHFKTWLDVWTERINQS